MVDLVDVRHCESVKKRLGTLRLGISDRLGVICLVAEENGPLWYLLIRV
jgi:hypothetical protein